MTARPQGEVPIVITRVIQAVGNVQIRPESSVELVDAFGYFAMFESVKEIGTRDSYVVC